MTEVQTRVELGPRLVIAMDFDSASKCLALASQLNPKECRLKVGKELFTLAGPELIHKLQGLGFDVFLDLKFHDIPNTVAKAVRAAASLGVWMVNVHAAGGPRMLEAAATSLESVDTPPLLIGVTVLTSLDVEDFLAMGMTRSPQQQVELYSDLVKASGLDGVVCSAQEVELLKARHGSGLLTVTPGIRPASAEQGDQKRVMTPSRAIETGSDYLVVGRPITQADDPAAMCHELYREIEQTLLRLEA